MIFEEKAGFSIGNRQCAHRDSEGLVLWTVDRQSGIQKMPVKSVFLSKFILPDMKLPETAVFRELVR